MTVGLRTFCAFSTFSFCLGCLYWQATNAGSPLYTGPFSLLVFFCAIPLLLLTAWEFTALTLFTCHGLLASRQAQDHLVPTALTSSQRDRAKKVARRCAALVPLNNEARTAEDRQQLAERLLALLADLPSLMPIFLLFDSRDVQQRKNEMIVVNQVRDALEANGRSRDIQRLHVVEYRKKDEAFKKSGSIYLFLMEYMEQFEFTLVVDADSSFRSDGCPESADSVLRMLYALACNPSLTLIQPMITCRGYNSVFSWWQVNESRSRFHSVLLGTLYGERDGACYGHNFVVRSKPFTKAIRAFLGHSKRRVLSYLSHDLRESAELSARGHTCIFTTRVRTFEAPESMPLYLQRAKRWCKGEFQGLYYLLMRRGLPWRTRIYLTSAFFTFAGPTFLCLFVGLGAAAMHREGIELGGEAHGYSPGNLLLLLVLVSLIAPRLFVGRTVVEVASGLFIATLLTPAFAVISARDFIFSGLSLGWSGASWTPRTSRVGRYTFAAALADFWLPVVFGVGILYAVRDIPLGLAPSVALMKWFACASILSPLTGYLLEKIPLRAGGGLDPKRNPKPDGDDSRVSLRSGES